MRGFTDRNGRRVGEYKQNRRTSWTGSPKGRKPRQVGAKLTTEGRWRNVAQTVTLPRGAKAKPAPSWRAEQERDRRPGQLALSGVVTGFSGVILISVTGGLLMVLGVVVALTGAAFGAMSLVTRVQAAGREPPLCPTHTTGYNSRCSTCRGRYQ